MTRMCIRASRESEFVFCFVFFLHFLYYEYWAIVHVWCIEAYPNNATNNPPGTCSCRPKARLATVAETSPTARTGLSKARTTRRSTRPTIRVSGEISFVWKHSPVSQLFPNVGFSPQGKKVKWADYALTISTLAIACHNYYSRPSQHNQSWKMSRIWRIYPCKKIGQLG